jgi:hypothetical protein
VSLPHEAEVRTAIAQQHRVKIDAMTNLHNAVVAMMMAGSWTVTKRRGVSPLVAQTMMGLLTKACKTFRAIQELCERGLHEDANALVRVLLETTVTVLYILQKNSRQRMRVYHAYGITQGIKMLNDWTQTPGLKRSVRKALIRRAHDELNAATKRLPAGTDVKSHWSGKRNLREAMETLKGGRVMYALVFRLTSSHTHGSDFGAHVTMTSEDAEPVFEVEPRVDGFDGPSYAARQLLWIAANRIDERLGLGFAASLAPHKVTRAIIEARQQ